MADPLEKVIDIAKKLRRAAKKVADPAVHSLITDLNLTLADLRVHMVEQRAAELDQTSNTRATHSAPAHAAAPVAATTPPTTTVREPSLGVLRGFPT